MVAPIPIKRIRPVTEEQFYETYVKRSLLVVIEGLVYNWPALNKWGWDYFEQNYAQILAPVNETRNGKIVADPRTGINLKRITFATSIGRLKSKSKANGNLIVAPVSVFGKQLKADYEIPRYCKNQKFLQSIVFISEPGTITSLHQDLPENLYVMVKGVKRITLFAPRAPVYSYPKWSRLPNFSQVDVMNPDLEKFPRFKLAQPYSTELKAGEALYIPSFWWHHLYHTEPSVSINFWWTQGWQLPFVWVVDKYRKLRKLGNESPTG